jgi:hypothetical protein
MTTKTRTIKMDLEFTIDKKQVGIDVLKISDLHIDSTYQRKLSPSKLQIIQRAFHEGSIGLPAVSLRGDGTFWIIDGQHRIEVMRKLGYKEVRCEVFLGMSRSEEALKWYELNVARGMPTALQRFKSSVEGGDKDNCELVAILAKHDCWIDYEQRQSGLGLRAVGALQTVYFGSRDLGSIGLQPKRYESVLGNVLDTIRMAYSDDIDGKSGMMIAALGLFYKTYKDVSVTELVRCLQRRKAIQLMAEARSAVKVSGTAEYALAAILVNEYNWKRRICKLPNKFGGPQ